MAGEALRTPGASKKNGKAIIDFNTYASSLGFPGRTIFEQKLYVFATVKKQLGVVLQSIFRS
jgi:hypothetical protein